MECGRFGTAFERKKNRVHRLRLALTEYLFQLRVFSLVTFL